MRTLTLCLVTLLAACETTQTENAGPGEVTWTGRHLETSIFGADDNSEVVKMTPDGDRAVLVASKARKLTLLGVTPAGLTVLRSAALFTDDAGESELTHLDIDARGTYAAITRTLPIKTGDTLTDCRGELVFVDIGDSDAFGTVLKTVPVGPMPDAVDLSPDGRWAVTADEVDYNDGKCPLPEITPSVTVIELADGDPTTASTRAAITLPIEGDGTRREPEQIIFAQDSRRVAVTLQDTHEVMLFSVDDVLGTEDQVRTVNGDTLTITRLPDRSTGAEPWPDGVACFMDAAGRDYFVVAGEYNDTFTVLDLDGRVVNHVELVPTDFPSDLPRNIEDWSHAPFRPDSIAPFQFEGHSYLAFSLKHAGAVGVWLVDDVEAITLSSVIKIGRTDGGTPVTESTIGVEGISAGPNGLIVTANEGESSASLVGPVLR